MVLKVWLWRAQKLLHNQSSLHRSWEKVILLFLPISWYWDPIVFYYRIGQLVTAKYQALFGTTTYSKRRVMAGVVMTRYAFGFNSQFIKNSCISSIHILHSSWHIAYIFSFLKVQLSEIFQVCASISVWIYIKLFFRNWGGDVEVDLDDEANAEVICVSSGTKCINGEQLSLEGCVINDSHAEIVTRLHTPFHSWSQFLNIDEWNWLFFTRLFHLRVHTAYQLLLRYLLLLNWATTTESLKNVGC